MVYFFLFLCYTNTDGAGVGFSRAFFTERGGRLPRKRKIIAGVFPQKAIQGCIAQKRLPVCCASKYADIICEQLKGVFFWQKN